MGLVLVTHDSVEAMPLARHALVPENGRVVEKGELDFLLAPTPSRQLRLFAAQVKRMRIGINQIDIPLTQNSF
ncbi:MAG: hypothetical protein J0M24_03645 [Verrucomicrobia bacterium]|nr:hypothetical protein [Verrucomicrobiota bacterium]